MIGPTLLHAAPARGLQAPSMLRLATVPRTRPTDVP
jgi:hypothetical protein